MIFDDYDGHRYPGMDETEVFPTFVLQLRNPTDKTSAKETDPPGDRTRRVRREATMLPLNHSGGKKDKQVN